MIGDLLLTHLLIRGVLAVTNLDKRQKPVQMPLLAFERYLQRDHLIVDDFRSNDVLAMTSAFPIVLERRGGHRIVDVFLDLGNVLGSYGKIYFRIYILRDRHATNVVQRLRFRSLLFREKRFMLF